MKMVKKRVEELDGAQLDWAVAKAEGRCLHQNTEYYAHQSDTGYTCVDCGKDTYREEDIYSWHPSRNWAQGGPIIEREHIEITFKRFGGWVALAYNDESFWQSPGKTPLIAAMRAFVSIKLGDEVEVPE